MSQVLSVSEAMAIESLILRMCFGFQEACPSRCAVAMNGLAAVRDVTGVAGYHGNAREW